MCPLQLSQEVQALVVFHHAAVVCVHEVRLPDKRDNLMMMVKDMVLLIVTLSGLQGRKSRTLLHNRYIGVSGAATLDNSFCNITVLKAELKSRNISLMWESLFSRRRRAWWFRGTMPPAKDWLYL